MKHKYTNIKGFTLIEILVSITILSIILASVMTIFISTSDINMKTDITRALQQNVKSITETIAEDVRKNGFDGVESNGIDDCKSPTGNKNLRGTKLCIGNSEYYLAQENILGDLIRVNPEGCSDIQAHCTIVKDGEPLMNSWVDVKDLSFIISGTGVKKVTLLMTLQPAIGKGIKPQLIKNNRFYFQTTFTERPTLN
ncbi:MAG: type II secretion system protein [Candidatus Gracilibacteria bacterium]|nr:type II secretion system protein [Candidatus Gracilibacteria bacterium]